MTRGSTCARGSKRRTTDAHHFYGSHDWYIAELDPETGRAFSYSPGHSGEWGYVDIAEMEATVGALSVIERDLHFTPIPTRKVGIG